MIRAPSIDTQKTITWYMKIVLCLVSLLSGVICSVTLIASSCMCLCVVESDIHYKARTSVPSWCHLSLQLVR